MKTYYLAELPQRFLELASQNNLIEIEKEAFGFEVPTAWFECKCYVNPEIHHKDECLYIGVQAVPMEGEMEKFPFCKMTEDEIFEMIEHYVTCQDAVPSNVRTNKRTLVPFTPSGLRYSTDPEDTF